MGHLVDNPFNQQVFNTLVAILSESRNILAEIYRDEDYTDMLPYHVKAILVHIGEIDDASIFLTKQFYLDLYGITTYPMSLVIAPDPRRTPIMHPTYPFDIGYGRFDMLMRTSFNTMYEFHKCGKNRREFYRRKARHFIIPDKMAGTAGGKLLECLVKSKF